MFYAIIIGVILLFLLKKHFNGGVCKIKADLHNKVIVLTGAARGMGQEMARQLAVMGGHIVFACRSQ